ncbi:hypothetical protein SteCoe_13047 [Stentor coeruleus]|uniref:Cadherin domain-containing protein n=1 Tax=Stentor coeruleus TaxID=5963 RepID=A0A1R2C988_9CILI|nr:hypothetical protein SteCoe_13047 [Stentor coeruleus]
MLFIILIFIASGLDIIKPLDPIYVLADKEYFPLALDDYFMGDELCYSIAPELPEATLKQSHLQSTSTTPYHLNLVPQSKVFTMKKMFLETSISTKYFLFPNGNHLYMIQLTGTEFSKTIRQFDNEIISFIVISKYAARAYVYLVTTGQGINELFSVKCTPHKFEDVNSVNTSSRFENFESSTLRFSKGVISNTLLATGCVNKTDYIIMFNVTSPSTPLILGEFPLQKQCTKALLSITYNNFHYIYVPNEQKIVKVIILNNTEIIISDALFLDTDGKDITSMDLQAEVRTEDINYIILGMTDGFIIISLNFKEVFFKTIGRNQAEVYVFPTFYHNVLLLKHNSSYSIKVAGSNYAFHVFGGIDLNITEQGISWAVYGDSDNGFFLIHTESDSLKIHSFFLNNAMLNLTSSNEDREYNFTIEDSLSNTKLEKKLVVKRPKVLGEIMALNLTRQSQFVLFNNFSASTTLNLYEYFSGYFLEAQNVSVNFSSNFFDYNVSYISNYYKKEVFEFENKDLWFTDIVSSTNDTYFYNKKNISVLKDNMLVDIKNLPVEVDSIISCPGYFIVKNTNNTGPMLLFTRSLYAMDLANTISLSCLSIQCSKSYVICENYMSLSVYYRLDLMIYNLYNLSSTSSKNFTSFYLYGEKFLCTIENTNILNLYSLSILGKRVLNLASKKLDKPANKILASLQNFFIFYNDSSVEISDSNGNYLKTILIPYHKSIYYMNDFFVFMSENELTVYNSTGYVTSSLIAQFFVSNYSISDVNYNNDIGLIIYMVFTSKVVVYVIPIDYSSAIIDINMINLDSIDKTFYTADITMTVINSNNSLENIIPVLLYTNGQAIYKNTQVIKEIQSNLLDLSCSSSLSVSLENIFLGQDLLVKAQGDSIFSLQQRISDKKTAKILDINITAFFNVETFNVYLIASENIIEAYDKSFQLIGSYEFKDKDMNTQCDDFSVVFEADLFIFAASCNSQIDFSFNTTDSILPINAMYFFSFDNEEIVLISNFTLLYPGWSIWGIEKIGGDFLLMALDFYSEDILEGFYNNHLQILLGTATEDMVYIKKYMHLSSNDLMMNYYYIIDFEGVYDPVFDFYYLYLLDVYTGLKILQFNNTQNTHDLLVKTLSLENGFSLIRCGLELYVALKNTTIFKYRLENWDNPVLIGKVYPYRNLYTVMHGALKCSKHNYADYLLTLIQDHNGNSFIHIIDNKAQELSSVITDVETKSKAIETYAYFYNSTTILVLTSTEVSFYTLNEYSLNIRSPNKCHKDLTYNLIITAENDNIMSSSASFVVTFKKSYSQGEVSLQEFPVWMWIGIAVLFIVLIGISYKLHKKCMRKKKIPSGEKTLFNYSYCSLE